MNKISYFLAIHLIAVSANAKFEELPNCAELVKVASSPTPQWELAEKLKRLCQEEGKKTPTMQLSNLYRNNDLSAELKAALEAKFVKINEVNDKLADFIRKDIKNRAQWPYSRESYENAYQFLHNLRTELTRVCNERIQNFYSDKLNNFINEMNRIQPLLERPSGKQLHQRLSNRIKEFVENSEVRSEKGKAIVEKVIDKAEKKLSVMEYYARFEATQGARKDVQSSIGKEIEGSVAQVRWTEFLHKNNLWGILQSVRTQLAMGRKYEAERTIKAIENLLGNFISPYKSKTREKLISGPMKEFVQGLESAKANYSNLTDEELEKRQYKFLTFYSAKVSKVSDQCQKDHPLLADRISETTKNATAFIKDLPNQIDGKIRRFTSESLIARLLITDELCQDTK